jgi:hypothetical protein
VVCAPSIVKHTAAGSIKNYGVEMHLCANRQIERRNICGVDAIRLIPCALRKAIFKTFLVFHFDMNKSFMICG